MAKPTKSIPLKRDGMSFPVKVFFSMLFFTMGFSIIGAGLRGAPATAPVVITIGMLMVTIGVAPYTMPILYRYLVPEEEATTA